ncbi:MAG: ankyrin repeat domain-containing protein [Gammaproteobacteria bacterium]
MLHSFLNTIGLIQDKGPLLYQAIKAGYKAKVDELLSGYIIPAYSSIKNPAGSSLSPFVLATESFNFQIFLKLRETYKHEFHLYEQRNALRSAALIGNADVVANLLDSYDGRFEPVDINWALDSAIRENHSAIVDIIVGNGVSISSKRIFTYACEGKHDTILHTLLERYGNEISANDKNSALRNAAQNGHTVIVATLLDRCGNEISAEYKGLALLNAAENGYTAIVTTLLGRCGNHIYPNYKCWALQGAAANGHADTLNALLANESVVALAALNNNAALRAAQMGRNGTEVGSEERARYDAVIARLMQIPAVAQLANQQRNHENDLADIVNFAENSMQSLSKNETTLVNHLKSHYAEALQDKTWDGIRAEILSYLESEYHQSPAEDGYHRVWMLENGARKPAAFIPADTIGLCPNGDECEVSWKSLDGTLNQKTALMSEVRSIYTLLSKESSLHQESQDAVLVEAIINGLDIPAHPHQGKPLPLEYTPNLHESALTAYYRHPAHNALRYLSNNNPWMSPQAEFVQTLQSGLRRAIVSNADKELISYYWLALCDELVTLERGFTAADNKSLFAATIAELNRGHNCDEHALYTEEQDAYENGIEGIQTTRIDDLQADRPSCSYGVTKRLLQSEYGHPYINCPEAKPLSLEILLGRMDDLLIKSKEQGAQFDNLLDRLKKLDLRVLEQIQQEISDSLELYDYEEQDKIMLDNAQQNQKDLALETPDEQRRQFIENTMRWFGKERIEEHHDIKLKFQHGSSGFRANQYDSYAQFIGECLDKPIKAFLETINTFIKTEIANRSQPKPIVTQFNSNHKRKRDDDADDSDNEIYDQLDDIQRKKVKL